MNDAEFRARMGYLEDLMVARYCDDEDEDDEAGPWENEDWLYETTRDERLSDED